MKELLIAVIVAVIIIRIMIYFATKNDKGEGGGTFY
jgi:hypothetical protein